MLAKAEKAAFSERTACINCGGTLLVELSRGSFLGEPLSTFLRADPSGEDILPYLEDAEWSFVKCTQCNQAFHRYILDERWTEKRFSEWMTADAIEAFDKLNPRPKTERLFRAAITHVEHIVRIERLTARIRNGQPVRLLDFGCGDGEFLETCRAFGFEVAGVDRSRHRSAANVVPSLDQIGNNLFHAVTLFEVLEHLNSPAMALNELYKRLLPGGVLILETPNCAGVTQIKSLSDYRKIHPLDHINAFTNRTLRSIAERQGFLPIRKGATHVSDSLIKIVRRTIKHLLGLADSSTQLYFVKPLMPYGALGEIALKVSIAAKPLDLTEFNTPKR